MKDFEKEKKLLTTIINQLDNSMNSDIVNIILGYLESKVTFADIFLYIPKYYHKNIILTCLCAYRSSLSSLKFVKKFEFDHAFMMMINMTNMALLTNVEHIDFSGYFGYFELSNFCIVSHVSISMFVTCKNLIYLNISNSNITLLPNDLPKLRELNCEDNKNIKFIPYFPNLKILNIRNTSVDIKLDDKYYANEHKVLIKYSNQKNAVNTSDHRLLMYDIVSDSIRFS